ncbi:hypothetical protein BASA61_007901 [Batrachochytrium salamandrivorans]|nr:hypothetical protein BASA61_007901 [Batrachochytrium salamandrivorans]
MAKQLGALVHIGILLNSMSFEPHIIHMLMLLPLQRFKALKVPHPTYQAGCTPLLYLVTKKMALPDFVLPIMRTPKVVAQLLELSGNHVPDITIQPRHSGRLVAEWAEFQLHPVSLR